MDETTDKKLLPDKVYFLSEIIGSGIYSTYELEKRIGKLSDIVIAEKGTIPHVMSLVVSRPFGEISLIIPVERIIEITHKKIIVNIESISQYEGKPAPDAMLLCDYVLDKKVIDIEERELSVVYDIKIIQINKKFYVSDVEVNKYGLLKRIGLKWLADFLKIKEETVSWKYIQALPNYISSFRGNLMLTTMKEKLSDIPPVDMADIIEELNQEQRALIMKQLETEHASDTFEEVGPNVQREIVSSLSKKHVAHLIDQMTPAQAADVLSVLPLSEKEPLLSMINTDLSKKILAILSQQEENIGNYMTDKFVKFSIYYSIEQARSNYKAASQNKEVLDYIYVVDSKDVLHGIVDIAELLKLEGNIKLRDIMTDNIVSLTLQDTLKSAYGIFLRYGFRAIPVLDEKKVMLGVILYKDIMNLKHRFV